VAPVVVAEGVLLTVSHLEQELLQGEAVVVDLLVVVGVALEQPEVPPQGQ